MNSSIAAPATVSTLSAWASFAWEDGVQIEALARLDTLQVRTRNTTYEITVLSPRTGEVLVRGGRFFPEHTRAQIAGSSLGGSFLKVGGIYAGFSLEILHEGERIVTTRVRSVVTGSAGSAVH